MIARTDLKRLTNPRDAHGVRHKLIHLLVFLILAKLGGKDGMTGMAEWIQHRGKQLVKL